MHINSVKYFFYIKFNINVHIHYLHFCSMYFKHSPSGSVHNQLSMTLLVYNLFDDSMRLSGFLDQYTFFFLCELPILCIRIILVTKLHYVFRVLKALKMFGSWTQYFNPLVYPLWVCIEFERQPILLFFYWWMILPVHQQMNHINGTSFFINSFFFWQEKKNLIIWNTL